MIMVDPDSTQPDNGSPTPASFWQVLGQRPIGFTLVTTRWDEPVGFVGLSVAHVCAEPPLVSVALDANNKCLPAIEASGSFAVNFLSVANKGVAQAFMKKGVTAAERFGPVNWKSLDTGSPVLLDALGIFDCVLERSLDFGHTRLFVGRVVSSWATEDGMPLVFFRGSLARWRITDSANHSKPDTAIYS